MNTDKLKNKNYKGIKVLQETARGLTNEQISSKMFLSVSSIEKYLLEVRRLLHAKNTVNAVYIALQKGLILMIICNITNCNDMMQRSGRRTKRLRRRRDSIMINAIVANKNFQGINLYI